MAIKFPTNYSPGRQLFGGGGGGSAPSLSDIGKKLKQAAVDLSGKGGSGGPGPGGGMTHKSAKKGLSTLAKKARKAKRKAARKVAEAAKHAAKKAKEAKQTADRPFDETKRGFMQAHKEGKRQFDALRDETTRQFDATSDWRRKMTDMIGGVGGGGAGGGGPGGGSVGAATFDPYAMKRKMFRSPEMEALSSQYAAMQKKRMGVEGPQMTGAQIGMSPQDQFRQQQLQLSQGLMGQAMGTGPSLAAMNYKRAAERGLAGQVAAAASQRGGRAGLQQLQLQRQAGDINRQMAADLPMAQLAEQQQMAGLASGIAGQGRGADIGLATSQAGLTQGARQANLQANLQAQQQKDQFAMSSMGAQTGIQKDLLGAGMKGEQLRADQQLGYDKLGAADAESRRRAEWERYLADQKLKGAYAQAGASAIAGGAQAMAGA